MNCFEKVKVAILSVYRDFFGEIFIMHPRCSIPDWNYAITGPKSICRGFLETRVQLNHPWSPPSASTSDHGPQESGHVASRV